MVYYIYKEEVLNICHRAYVYLGFRSIYTESVVFGNSQLLTSAIIKCHPSSDDIYAIET